MSKIYITFGQIHVHSINGETFDNNCVAVIKCKDREKGRELAFEYFGDKWAFDSFDKVPDMKFYPRGLIDI